MSFRPDATVTYWALQLLNSLTFASLLYLLASGFTLIFGQMRVVNLAHGAFYLIGGYLGYSVIQASGSFWLGLLVGTLATGLIGLLLDQLLIARVRGQELPEVLLTMGIAFVIGDLCQVVWGGEPVSLSPPDLLSGSYMLGPILFPKYRLFLLLAAVVLAALLGYLHRYTRFGAILRAGVDDAEMVSALGINIHRIFAVVFFAGSALAGLAGVLGGTFLSLYPGADMEILLYALIVVAIGGLGSLRGAIVGSLLVGLLDTFGKVFLPELTYFTLFAPMVLVLALRPRGLFGESTS